MTLVVGRGDEASLPIGRELGQQAHGIGVAADLPEPGQIEARLRHQPPGRAGCIAEQQVTTHHQVKALVLKRQLRQAGGLLDPCVVVTRLMRCCACRRADKTRQLNDQDLEHVTGGAALLGVTPEMLRNAMSRVGLPRPVRPGENDHEIYDRIPR